MFQPPPGPVPTASGATCITYRTADGHRLEGYFVGDEFEEAASPVPLPRRERPFVLAFHGNADLAIWLVPWARELNRRTGACVFLAEYRGYAGLPGIPTYVGTQADALAAVTLLRESYRVSINRCVYFGHSLGSAVAAELGCTIQPAALVLQSPFTSARAMATRMLIPSILPFWTRFSRVHFDVCACVRRLHCPVFVAHGQRDQVVPVSMGHQVYHAARRPGEFLLLGDAGHNDVSEVGGEKYWAWLSTALSYASPSSGKAEFSAIPRPLSS